MKPGVYQHYKGPLYLFLFLARHRETKEFMVVYIPLYEIAENAETGVQASLCPVDMWSEDVNGVPRFKHVGAAQAYGSD